MSNTNNYYKGKVDAYKEMEQQRQIEWYINNGYVEKISVGGWITILFGLPFCLILVGIPIIIKGSKMKVWVKK